MRLSVAVILCGLRELMNPSPPASDVVLDVAAMASSVVVLLTVNSGLGVLWVLSVFSTTSGFIYGFLKQVF